MSADQTMWAQIICRRLGIEFDAGCWHRITPDSDIFTMRVGWKRIALLPDGTRAVGIED